MPLPSVCFAHALHLRVGAKRALKFASNQFYQDKLRESNKG